MTEEQYKSRIKDVDKRISVLKIERAQLQTEYVDSLKHELAEKGISYGTKVRVTYTDWTHKKGAIECYYSDTSIVWDTPKHRFRQIKKDGTMSQREQYLSGQILEITPI